MQRTADTCSGLLSRGNRVRLPGAVLSSRGQAVKSPAPQAGDPGFKPRCERSRPIGYR